MSETLTAIEPEVAKDLTTIMQDGIPVAWAAFNTGGIGACITAGITFIKAELPTLAEEIQVALGAELAAKAKALLAPAPITTIPSETVINTAGQ